MMGLPVHYGQYGSWISAGPPWFVVVLFFFNVFYGFAHSSDEAQRFTMAFPHLGFFLFVGVALGIVNATLGDAPFLVFMNGVPQFVSSATFFCGGITAKRNGWLEHLEQMPMPKICFLRCFTGLLVLFIWLSV